MADLRQRLSREGAVVLVVDLQERLYPHIEGGERILDNVKRLVGVAQQLGIPLGVIEQYPEGLGHTVGALEPMLVDRPTFAKRTFSAFGCERFQLWLEELRARSLVLVGMETHVCVLQTALDALRRGFGVYVLADSVGSRRSLDREVALERMRQAGAVITTLESAVFEWLERAATPEFRAVLPYLK